MVSRWDALRALWVAACFLLLMVALPLTSLPSSNASAQGAAPSPVSPVTPTATPPPTTTPAVPRVQALITATASPTWTPNPLILGGRDFKLTSFTNPNNREISLSWGPVGSGAQAGYVVLRLSSSGLTVLPRGAPLPRETTSFYDPDVNCCDGTSPPDAFYCYMVVPVGPQGGVLGNSDLLCVLPNTHQGVYADYIGVSLKQSSTATVDRFATAPLVPFIGVRRLTDGAALVYPAPEPRWQYPPPTYDTQGAPTCFAILVVRDGQSGGNSDWICAFPGQAHLLP
jgi:hypothetical protein